MVTFFLNHRILPNLKKKSIDLNSKKNNSRPVSIRWKLNMAQNLKWLPCWLQLICFVKNKNKVLISLKKSNLTENNMITLKPNLCPINNLWPMPEKVYLQITHLNKCFMLSEMRLRKIEKSSMIEWLSNLMKDLKSYNKLKNFYHNLQSPKTNLWCLKTQWPDLEEQLVKCKKNFPKKPARMIN